MTTFLRLLADKDKANNLLASCTALRAGDADTRVFQLAPESFRNVPGAPFAYWVSDAVRESFLAFPSFESELRQARQGGVNGDDFRWLRLWYEAPVESVSDCEVVPIGKGGSYSTFYSDLHLVARWDFVRNTFFSFNGLPHRPSLQPASFPFFFRPCLTWPRRTNGLSFRLMPQGCIFADKGPAAFVDADAPDALLALCALVNSKAFGLLVSVQLARVELAQSFEVGLIQQTPVPDISDDQQATLAALALRAWSHKRTLNTIEETSHAFVLPAALRARLGDYAPSAIAAELSRIQAEIDDIAFDLYGFSESDRAAALGGAGTQVDVDEPREDDEGDEGDEDDQEDIIDDAQSSDGLLSWAVGVAFGRFDWRLATAERTLPPEPEPFDPLPVKSPGMLPDAATPFHKHAGILVDDQGHPYDLARLVEQVLESVDAPVAEDVRRWLRKDFFAFHLKRYSKSRRKAPIYWPLATASGSYTLWFYYPSLSDQTLFSAVNDFVDPKLKDVRKELQDLRDKGAGRSQQDEKRLEALVSLEHELADLRDSFLEIAPNYRPNHDDGVQITAAPLWKLFRHKPWQKVLKETWAKLEKGDYDWAHLAMNYWSQRVRDKCTTDKSLAIAHNLEHLYIEPEAAPKKTRGRARKQDV